MTTLPRSLTPVSAMAHRAAVGSFGWDAVSLITVYLVLLLAIPSNVTISSMGSFGRPALLWGLILFAYWALSRLQWRSVDVAPVGQPARVAFLVLLAIALVSFAAAILRGQPVDQVSPLITSILRLVSWAGVLLVIIDGVRTMYGVARLLRRICIGVTLLALLGLMQGLTGSSLLEFWGSVPGLTLGEGGTVERLGMTRSAGTATHPLEFSTVINATIPLCIAAALSRGFRWRLAKRAGLWWWVATALLVLVALTGVSRSAIIGFVVAVVAMIPPVASGYRLRVIAGGVAVTAALVAAVPGLAGSTLGLFTGIAEDGSTLSRTGALDRLPGFVSASPLFGVGFGVFLPRYYIFDNQWAQLAIDLGVLGVLAFGAMLAAAIWSAWYARHHSAAPDVQLIGHALAASVLTASVVFAFFDGLAFPISAGFLFVLVGLCAAVRTAAVAESSDFGGAAVWTPTVVGTTTLVKSTEPVVSRDGPIFKMPSWPAADARPQAAEGAVREPR